MSHSQAPQSRKVLAKPFVRDRRGTTHAAEHEICPHCRDRQQLRDRYKCTNCGVYNEVK